MKKLLFLGCFLLQGILNTASDRDYVITLENREAMKKQHQEEKDAIEKDRQAAEKQRSDEEYLRLCEKLLLSKEKCILSVKLTYDLYGGMNLSIQGKCLFDEKKDKVDVLRKCERGLLGQYIEAFKNRNLHKSLSSLLDRSILLDEEKEIFKQLINGQKSGTIVRDGDRLFIFNSSNKTYEFSKK